MTISQHCQKEILQPRFLNFKIFCFLIFLYLCLVSQFWFLRLYLDQPNWAILTYKKKNQTKIFALCCKLILIFQILYLHHISYFLCFTKSIILKVFYLFHKECSSVSPIKFFFNQNISCILIILANECERETWLVY